MSRIDGAVPLGEPPIRFSGAHRQQDLPFVEPLRRFPGITSFASPEDEPDDGYGMGC